MTAVESLEKSQPEQKGEEVAKVEKLEKAEELPAVFIGKKPFMAYISASLMALMNSDKIVLKARGRAISRAVDVAQMLTKKVGAEAYELGETKIDTQDLQDPDGTTKKVSTIEIVVKHKA